MIFFIAALFLLTSCGAVFSKHDEFNKDYISKDGTVAIKGIFVFLIFLGHAMTYIDATGTFDLPYVKIQRYLDQMVVSMFFFYSGFGIMEQIKHRGGAYIGTIPKKRFPRLLLNMDICVVLFIILNAAIGQTFGAKQILLSLIGWESVGNSNWYIFVMLALYVVTYLSFLIIKKKQQESSVFGFMPCNRAFRFAYFCNYKGQSRPCFLVRHSYFICFRNVVFLLQKHNRKGFNEKRFDLFCCFCHCCSRLS